MLLAPTFPACLRGGWGLDAGTSMEDGLGSTDGWVPEVGVTHFGKSPLTHLVAALVVRVEQKAAILFVVLQYMKTDGDPVTPDVGREWVGGTWIALCGKTRKVVFFPTYFSYFAVGASLKRKTASCVSISAPRSNFNAAAEEPTTAHVL